MSGNQQGAIFFHMKASRSFVLKLLDMNIDQLSEHQLAVRAFVLEMYAFFTFTAHVPPYRQTETPKYQLRYDPFLWKLEAYGHSDVSGSAFCGTYFLFSLIPRISSLSHDWNQEFTPSQRPTMEEFQILEHQIKYQQPPSEVRIRESDDLQSSIITEICRCAVLIYLYDAMRKWGDESQQDFLITIQQYSIRGLALLSKIRPSSSINMLGWPAAIIGSGLVDKGHRATMKKILAFPVFQLARRLPEMLELVWTDSNQDFGGPYSLYITMASQNHFPCIW